MLKTQAARDTEDMRMVQLKELEPGVRAGDQRVRKHRSRRDVDPFASVPVYTDDLPLHDEPSGDRGKRDCGGHRPRGNV